MPDSVIELVLEAAPALAELVGKWRGKTGLDDMKVQTLIAAASYQKQVEMWSAFREHCENMENGVKELDLTLKDVQNRVRTLGKR